MAGGTVKVRTGARDDGAWVTMSNDGPMVRPSEVERLYSPFERLDGERSTGEEGFGLGLCIVRAIVTAHGATVRHGGAAAGRPEDRGVVPDP